MGRQGIHALRGLNHLRILAMLAPTPGGSHGCSEHSVSPGPQLGRRAFRQAFHHHVTRPNRSLRPQSCRPTKKHAGQIQVTQETSLGNRVIDNLTPDGVAQESKFGSQSLNNDTAMQAAKDVELMRTPGNGITDVEWHFFPNATGGGPSQPLVDLLQNVGIKVIFH